MTKNKDLIDYFKPGKNGENKLMWIELKITAKIQTDFKNVYILKDLDLEKPIKIFENPYKKLEIKKKINKLLLNYFMIYYEKLKLKKF